jgi:RNA polymerase sigma factor (sigma-70 family)
MTITALPDTDLLDQARHGDEAAFTELYVRHQPAALRLARTYRRFGDPDDLVNSAFERVLGALRRGAGPTQSFRAYLFVTLRRLATEHGTHPPEASLDEVPVPVVEQAAAPGLDPADRDLISQAFETLPDQWQAVLWHTAVEGRQPRELAETLGVTPNAAAAMAYRAREKLRQAYLQAHLLTSPAPDHEPWRSQLGAYVRDGLSKRDRAAVDQHLQDCASCTRLVAELDDVNRTLTRSVVPLFALLGGGEVIAAAAAGAAAGGGATGGKTNLFTKARTMAPTVGSTAAIAALLGGIVGMGAIVGREDGGPLDTSADAADIGGGEGDRGGSGSGRDDSDDDRDTLFGDDDFALSPFDESLEDDFGDFGDNFDFDDDFDFDDFDRDDDRRGRGGGRVTLPSSPGGSSPGIGSRTPAAAPGPAPVEPAPPAPAPPAPQPHSPPPPPPPPAPPELAFVADTSTWTAAPGGTGTLHIAIGEAAAADQTAAVTTQAYAPLTLGVTLTGGATFAGQGQPGGCAPAGAAITCTFDQPAAGERIGFDLVLEGVTAPGQTATAQIMRAGEEEPEDALSIDLVPYVPEVALGTSGWQQHLTGSVRLPVGTVTFQLTNTGDSPIAAATFRATLLGDAAFVPPGTDAAEAATAIEDRLFAAGWGRGHAPTFEPYIAAALPPECRPDGWTAPVPFGWASALTGGLPTAIVCDVGPVAPGATVTVTGVTILGNPAYDDGDGAAEGGVGNLSVMVDGVDTEVDVTFDVPVSQPPSAGG